MAITYSLSLDTDWSPARLYEVVAASVRVERALERDVLTFHGDGLWGAINATGDVSRMIFREDFSFDPRMGIAFRLDKFDLEHAQRSLVRCACGVLVACPDDALLLWNGETPVLRRKAGDLALNEAFGLWEPERPYRELVTLPHRMEPMAMV